MRLVKLLLTALVAAVAIAAGLVFAAATAVVLFVFFFLRRLLRTGHSTNAASPRATTSRPHTDVIEVTATEVPARNLEIEKS